MNTIPNYRSAHLMPYLAHLQGMGAPVETALRQSGLPTMVTTGDDIYLPLFQTFSFLKEMESSQGIDEMPLRALGKLQITDLSERFVSSAFQSPTLKIALASFRELVTLEDPHVEFWMPPGETTVRLCMFNHLPMDRQSLRFEDWNELLVLITIVQAFAGSAWQPEEMAFRSNLPLNRYASEQYPNTRFLVGQKAAWIALPYHMLSLPPSNMAGTDSALGTSNSEKAMRTESVNDLTVSLRKILPAYLGDGYPSIQLAAKIASTSVRSLQRKLKESNMSYSELVQHARFELASKQLIGTNTKIIEIANQLGYEDPAHFTRAFVRMAGISPRAYRNQYRMH